MSVTLSLELEEVPCWQEIRDYVNKRKAEEGWDDSIFVRPATHEEETKFWGSADNSFVTRREDGTIELVVGLGKNLHFEEIKMLHGKLGIAVDNSILMHLWIAQVACQGKYFGAFDS